MKRFSLVLILCAVATVVFAQPVEVVQSAIRDGIFGISGIIPDASYFEELRIDCVTSGFWIGPSAGFLGGSKEELHTRQMRTFVSHGITPIATFYLGNIGPDAATHAEQIVAHYTTGQGAEDVGIPILYWEIGDEENGTWGTSCEPEEYARRVSILAPAIRRACPECTIIMGGLLDGPEMGDWALEPYLRRFLVAGGGDWIDTYAFHYYGLARPDPRLPNAQLYYSAVDIVDTIRDVLVEHGLENHPIWVTETSTFSGGMGSIAQSESEQAADLVKRYILLWSLGVEKVQWCYLTEPQFEGTGVGFFDQSGLIYDGIGPYDRGEGTKKRSYYAYFHLIERLRLAELGDLWREDGVTCARFDTVSGPVCVLWQDPWVRQGPIWVQPSGTVIVEDLAGERLGQYEDRFRLDLDIEPVYLRGSVSGISQAAPRLHSGG